MDNKPDIFDRIMSWRIAKPFRPFYDAYKEPLLYLFFGGLTTVLSIGLFWAFTQPLHMNALTANAAGWVLCVLFAYVTNRTWVFQDRAHGAKGILRECGTFILGRVGTLVMEEAVLWLGIDLLGMNSMLVKVFAQVLVVLGNYFISKWFVFASKPQSDE